MRHLPQRQVDAGFGPLDCLDGTSGEFFCAMAFALASS
jgi:hypothetical protein